MKIDLKAYRKKRAEDGWVLGALALVLSAAGTGLSMKAQSDSQHAQDEQKTQELYRQAQFQKKAAEVVNQQIAESGADKARPAIDAAADARAAAYNRITAPTQAPATKTVSRTVSTPFAAATANQSSLSDAWNRIIGGAQARAGGFQDWGLARNIAQQRASQEIGLIGRNARGSASVSAAEQQDASHAGDGTAAAGGLLSVAGRGLGAYAATTPTASANTSGMDAWGNPVDANGQSLMWKMPDSQAYD